MSTEKHDLSKPSNVVPLKGDAESIAKALGKGKEREGQDGWWNAPCPVHQGRRSNLGLKDTKKGLVINCLAKCPAPVVREELIKLGYLRLPTERTRTKLPKSKKVTESIYKDAKRNPVLMVERIDYPDRPKDIFQYSPDGDGGWVSGITDKDIKIPPYNLPRVLRAISKGITIYIVEGEKLVEHLREINLVATCNSMGAGNWKDHHSEFLVGADVVILPDNDEPGRKHAEDVARSLEDKAKQVKVVHLPDLPEKGDVVDYLARKGTREDLKLLAEETPEWLDVVDENSPLVSQISSVVVRPSDLTTKRMRGPRTLIEPWLKEASYNIIYSEPGVGKTWLCLVLAAALTRDSDDRLSIGPWQTKRNCGTLYIDGEMGEFQLNRRIRELTKTLSPESKKHPLALFPSDRFSKRFRKQINLCQVEWRDAIYEFLANNPQYRHVIFDNKAALAPSIDENAKRDWDPINQWLISLRHLGLAVTLVHHAGKSGKQRGTSGLEDPVDTIIKLARPKSYNSGTDGAFFDISFDKKRNVKPDSNTEPFSLRILEDPSNPRSLIWQDGSSKQRSKSKKNQIMAEIIEGKLRGKELAGKFDVEPSYISQLKKKAKELGYIDNEGHATKEGDAFTKERKKGQEELF